MTDLLEGRLVGRLALVTGAGRGIGRAIAHRLAAEGARLALVARSAHEIAETARQVRADGGQAVAVPADLADHRQLGQLPTRVRDECGEVDILVNNAGVVWPLGPSAAVDPGAHTLNLAAELADTGVTVNVFRPGAVDTSMPAWIRGHDPAEIGAALHDYFVQTHARGALLTPEASARSMVARLAGQATGQLWDVADPL
jgi:NAD(P)-dependent dehydrogenase (short-subunit alcohol dehydrogenase family)